MATILLSAAGAAVGGAFGGTAFGLSTAVIGRAVGATLGNVIDQRLMGGGSEVIETGRMDRFRLTGAGEGTALGRVYGRMRVGGQVIWATRFRETVKTSESGGGKGGGGGGVTTKQYRYSVSMAVALCEGEILRVGRVWADGDEVELGDLNMRVYRGTDGQLPDPKIEAVEGADNAPAYRGTAYVVFEDLSLAKFGNRVPQFSFEVMRATDKSLVPKTARSLSDTIRAVAMIPGTGEYSLATTPVHFSSGFGWNKTANMNSGSGETDFSSSVSHLKDELPKCESVSLVVSWFGNDLRCGECNLEPKVEQVDFDGVGMSWNVSGLAREDARTVIREDGRPLYGGTPTDKSVMEAIGALNDDGKSVMFYPFILMDQMSGNLLRDPWSGGTGQTHLPWRGRITTSLGPNVGASPDGSSQAEDEVDAFFGTAAVDHFFPSSNGVNYVGPHEWSYRRFILHYAHLCAAAGGVGAFCIGSEMRALTQIRGAGHSFPAVEQLKTLAADVRKILGPDVEIGYCADWSEYFGYQPQDGSGNVYFHLDPLWADHEIDFIGIDNYMPLSDWRDGGEHLDADAESIYSIDYLRSNVAGGEGYDWYYADQAGRDAQERTPITDGAHGEPWIFRYKDILNWWRNPHHQRIGGARQAEATDWQPESKPVWFTELGCAAIDKGTNQPNKFLDPKSSESRLPYFSDGARDDFMQAQYLRAMHLFWSDASNNPTSSVYNAPMIDMGRAHVWAWDARPYPAFPERDDLWSDGENYRKGHWLNGRTTSESLAAVVADICGTAGLMDVDVERLYGIVRGYTISEPGSARAAIQPLMLGFGFDASESEGKIHFRSRSSKVDAVLDAESFATRSDGSAQAEHRRAPDAETAGSVRLNYVQAAGDFEVQSSEAIYPDDDSIAVSATDLPLSLAASEGQHVVERWLSESRVSRDTLRLALPPSGRTIGPGDVVQIETDTGAERYRVDHMEIGEKQELDATRIEPDLYRRSADVAEPKPKRPTKLAPLPVHPVFMELPLLTGDENPAAPYVAVSAQPWPGDVALYSSPEDDGYQFNSLIEARATMGVTETALHSARPGMLDRGVPLRVRLGSGQLSTIGGGGLLNGRNAMAIGDPELGTWEVFQFRLAELVGSDTYELSERLRGQAGTDGVLPPVWPVGSVVVLLDGAPTQIELASSLRNVTQHYRIGPASRSYDDSSYVHEAAAFSGAGLRPYAPAHLRSTRDDTSGTEFSWIRRTRIDGDNWDGIDVPLGESSEQYLVQVVQGGSVRREVICTQPGWTYTGSQKSADGIGASYAVQVAQISERFGAGPFRRIEIDE